MTTGVYQIINTLNGKSYVGSSLNCEARILKGHLQGKTNPHLKAAVSKYGVGNFRWQILVECKPIELLRWEQHYIDLLQPEYNMAPVAGNCLGVVHDQAFRDKVSQNLRGNQHTKGRKLSDEHKAAISAKSKGKPKSILTRLKMAMAAIGNTKTKGYKYPPESIEKRSKSQMGHFVSQKTRDAVANANRKRKKNKESK